MRVDKTDSAVGVVRGTLAADVAAENTGKVLGVGFNAQGRTVLGAGTSGVIGVIIPNKISRKAGDRCDIFVLAEILADSTETPLTAGAKYYVDNTTGALTATATGGTQVGFSAEVDRLVIRL